MPIVYDDEPPAAPTGTVKYDAPPQPAYKGGVLPFSRDTEGKVSFDPFGAGPIGSLRQAVTLPGRVLSGETPLVAGTPQATGEVMNLAGWVNPVNPMVRSGDRPIPGVTMAKKDPSLAKVPTSEQLLEAGGRRMDQFEHMPIPYDPRAIGALGTQIEQEILKHGILPENSPQLYAFINAAKRYQPQSGGPGATTSFSPANLKAMRENLATLFGKSSEHQKGVGVAFGLLNDFIERPPAGATLAGSPAFLQTLGPELYATGRADYAAGMRTKALEDIKRTADLRSGAVDRDAANSYRSRIAAHILDAKKVKGYTEAEQAALENVALDTPVNKIKRAVGGMMGGGLGPGGAAAGGIVGGAAGLLGLPPGVATAIGAATPGVGAWLKRSAGEGTEEALNKAIDQMKRRSPLFRSMGRQDLVPDIQRGRDAIARALSRMPTTYGGVPLDLPVLEYDPNRA